MMIRRYLRSARKKNPERIEQDLQGIIREGEEAGMIDPYSGQMMRNILKFRDTVVREVMIPRTEIVAAQTGASLEDILEVIARHGYTRIPLYSGTIDNIVGILNVKDLLQMWSKEIREGDLVASLKKPYYIPETKNVNLLLHELKRERHHMAVVIDEYGGTSGIVTIEDLIEEIVGEIFDEDEEEDRKMVELPDGSIIVDARTEVEEISEYFGLPVPEGPFETLGGFILHLLRKIPVTGEKVIFQNLEMIIEAADERSIRKVRMKTIGDTGRSADAARMKRGDE